MRPKFNVLQDGWIPVVDTYGRREKLGIRDTLARAHELRAVEDASPLVEYSVYRFLSVFLMDALRPEELDTLEEILEYGQFDMGRIDEYIALCQSEGVSFNLFDEQRPFMQTAYDAAIDREPKPVTTLNCELPTGNSHTHFDHRAPASVSFLPDQAMRQLLTALIFCTAAAQGYPSGVYASPLLFEIVQGENLFETLVYTLIPTESIAMPFDDPPVLWRSKCAVSPKKEVTSTSWLRGMLFPTRRILLVPNESGNVPKVYYSQGENYVNKEVWRDPFATYRISEDGIVPLRPHREMPIWRNLNEIIDIPGNQASRVLSQYRRLNPSDHAVLTLYGVETNQASYLGEMRCNLRLPMEICADSTHVDWVEKCIGDAETLARATKKALVSSGAVPETICADAVKAFYESAGAELLSLCESAAERAPEALPALHDEWVGIMAKTAARQYDRTTASLHLRGRALAAAASARKILTQSIHKLKEGVA